MSGYMQALMWRLTLVWILSPRAEAGSILLLHVVIDRRPKGRFEGVLSTCAPTGKRLAQTGYLK